MHKISRLSGGSDGIELDFVEREATPIEIMEHAIHPYLGGLSLSKTVSILDRFGVDRARSTVHNRVQKADLEPRGGRVPAQIALDETVVKVNGERFCLVASVDPDTNVILHVGLYASRNTAMTKTVLRELQDKHIIDDAEFLVDGAPWLHAGLFELGMHFRHETHGDRNPVERVFQEIKRRTTQFYDTFSRASPQSAQERLKALSWAWNQLI
jgi:transposase-like protein